jgi:hypothetical protein
VRAIVESNNNNRVPFLIATSDFPVTIVEFSRGFEESIKRKCYSFDLICERNIL